MQMEQYHPTTDTWMSPKAALAAAAVVIQGAWSVWRQGVCVLLLLGPLAVRAGGNELPAWSGLTTALSVTAILADERYGEARIPTAQDPQQIVRGRHWEANLKSTGAQTEPKAIWESLKPSLLKEGWSVVDDRPRNPLSVSLRQMQGRDAWMSLTLFAADDIRLDLVEVGDNRLRLKLPAPSARAQGMKADKTDFAFLLPPPGSQFTSADQDEKPMLVTLQEQGQEIRQQVASGSVVKYYRTPKDLSNLDFAQAYRVALLAAGWTLPRYSQSVNSADTLLVAHYGAQGRDMWAVLRHAPGEAMLQVGDAGLSDMAQALQKDCRVTLLGVLFDFDKATLKPESDAALARAHAAIAAKPGLALEVQGHTDAVGNDAYNQKLSQARAQSVLAWLTARGVSPTQLTARGYGKGQPVASNDTDDGRARNRRVELVCRK